MKEEDKQFLSQVGMYLADLFYNQNKMEAKLIKTIDGYELFTQGFLKGSTNHGLIDSLNVEEGSIRYKLSLKNCQAIEGGYNLDELVKREYLDGYDTTELCRTAFKDGFQKALELMGDKKFSEDDVILIAEYIRVASQSTPSVRTKDLFNEYQSLQQTEWDVEIEMEVVSDFYSRSDQDGSIFTSNKKEIPKLDVTGYLILKLKSE